MVARELPGRVVVTASLAGLVTFPGGGAYAATKHALVAVADEDEAVGVAEVVLDPAQVVVRRLDAPGEPARHVRGGDEEVVETAANEDVVEELVRALIRPAAEESHYYREESGQMTFHALERLAGDERAVVVFAPRYPRQAEYLSRFDWPNEPIVLGVILVFAAAGQLGYYVAARRLVSAEGRGGAV